MEDEIDEKLAQHIAALRRWSEFRQHLQDQSWVKKHSVNVRGEPKPIDVRSANKLALLYGRLADELSRDQKGRIGIEALLDDQDPYVRTHAAVRACGWGSPRARRVLEEVAKGRGLAAADAKWALRRLDGIREA